MGLKRNGVKVLLKHCGDLVEKVMTKGQFESFIKSQILDVDDPWFLIAHKPCIIDKYGNQVVGSEAIEQYYGFEEEKATPQGKDDYFMTNTDLMDVIKVHQGMDKPVENVTVPRKKLQFKAPTGGTIKGTIIKEETPDDRHQGNSKE